MVQATAPILDSTETVMQVLSPQVHDEEMNGPSSVAVQGQSLTQPGHGSRHDRRAVDGLFQRASAPVLAFLREVINESLSRRTPFRLPLTTSTPREEQATTAIPSQTWRSLDV
jgi:hypothetical protein